MKECGYMSLNMNSIFESIQLLSAASLGLFVGALLMEALVLVPMWQSLNPKEFFELHEVHAKRLYIFFAPLTTITTLLAILAAIASVLTSSGEIIFEVLSLILSLVVLATYFFYFQQANAKFAKASIKDEHLSTELAQWAAWHWFRTAMGSIAFGSALLALHHHT
jgi:TM2 domain-containing membrane protein YozV